MWPYRYFANYATDLLKYVYFFAAVKEHQHLLEIDLPVKPEVRYVICFRRKDLPILRLYPDVLRLEGLKFYEYES